MGRFESLRDRIKSLGHGTAAPLMLFKKLDEDKKGDVTLNYSDLVDLEGVLSRLVTVLEEKS